MVTLYDLGISISFIVGNSKISVKNAAESEKDYDSNELTTILFREYQYSLNVFIVSKKKMYEIVKTDIEYT